MLLDLARNIEYLLRQMASDAASFLSLSVARNSHQIW